MKRILLPLLFLPALGCSPQRDSPLLGYVEAEPTRIASPLAGRLVQLSVARGDTVAFGAALFELDTDIERTKLDEADARHAQSEALALDLSSGKRPAELDVLRAREAAARSALSLTESELARQQSLASQGFISLSSLDYMYERVHSAQAQLDQAVADRRAAELSGRIAQRIAARAAVKVAESQRAQANTHLLQKSIFAPTTARVEDTYFRIGEWVPAGTPVVSLLSSRSIKLRFYIPEPKLALMRLGTTVHVQCDGCGTGFDAKINWIAAAAEYTPPVIYSKDNRAKLVFRAEATPLATLPLLPGLPVSISAGGDT